MFELKGSEEGKFLPYGTVEVGSYSAAAGVCMPFGGR